MDDETPLLGLERAFLWVVTRLEELEADDAPQHVEAAPGLTRSSESPSGYVASGPRYRAAFTPKPQPRRGGGEPYRWPAHLPRIPNWDRLSVLLEDHEMSREETSAAERRVCQAHLWLIERLRNGQIGSWADQHIQNNEAGLIRVTSQTKVPTAWWEECDPNYGNATAVAHGEWTVRVRRREVCGRLELRDIAVDEAALKVQLLALQSESGAVDAEWRFERRPEGEVCLVKWGEAEILIPLLGREAVSRGMRAIAVLVQSPRVPVANLLLAELERRHVDTRPEKTRSAEWTAIIDLRASLRPLCQSLFAGSKTVEEVHAELASLLSRNRDLDRSFTEVLPRLLLSTNANGAKQQKHDVTYR